MEKLMTTFEKTKKDIIKEALEEAERAAISENKEATLPSSPSKKRPVPRTKKTLSLPWQKLALGLSEDFLQSCSDLETLITTGFHSISAMVSQKHARTVKKLKDDLLDYISNHRSLEWKLIAPSIKKVKTDLPWQKQEVKLSKEFLQSCDNLKYFIVTGFDKLFKVISQKNIRTVEILKDDLLNYLNNHHRELKLLQISLSPAEEKKKAPETTASEVTPNITLSETAPETALPKAIPETILPAET